jgi:tetratricopeptide (TPR) repeat protein
MQVRFTRVAVFVVAASAAAGGCGKYSISNIRSAKAFQDANEMYKKADYQGAVARYEDSIRFNPELGFAYFFLGNSYDNLYKPAKKDDPANRANLEKAAEHYRTAIQKLTGTTNPKEQEIRKSAFEFLIAIYQTDKLNDFAKAEPVAKELIAASPNDPAPYGMLAQLYEDQGRFEEAEEYRLKAVQVSPKDPTGYQLLAGFYNRQGQFEKTMDAWNRRAEMEPNNAEAWHTIGVYYQDKVFKHKNLNRDLAKEYTLKGIAAEDKALAINSEYFEALTYKNILLLQQALYEKDPARQKALTEEANRLRDKAIAIQKKQNAEAGNKGAGS